MNIAVLDSGLSLANATVQGEFQDVRTDFWDLRPATNPPVHVESRANYFDAQHHGSLIATLLASRNDGRNISGIISGLYDVNVPPDALTLTVYAVASVTANGLALTSNVNNAAALDRIRARVEADGVRIVNMSFGNPSEGDYRLTVAAGELPGNYFADRFQAMPEVLFVAAAGNQDRDAELQRPSSLTRWLDNVISVAAVAPSQESGNLVDARADFNLAGNPASNYGSLNSPGSPGVIDLAAPAWVRAMGPGAASPRFAEPRRRRRSWPGLPPFSLPFPRSRRP